MLAVTCDTLVLQTVHLKSSDLSEALVKAEELPEGDIKADKRLILEFLRVDFLFVINMNISFLSKHPLFKGPLQ